MSYNFTQKEEAIINFFRIAYRDGRKDIPFSEIYQYVYIKSEVDTPANAHHSLLWSIKNVDRKLKPKTRIIRTSKLGRGNEATYTPKGNW